MTHTRAIKHLELLEEGWKRDHHEAMEYNEFEESLTELVSVFRIIQVVGESTKQRVFNGITQPEVWDQMREGYERWLAVADSQQGQAGRFERAFGRVRNAQELKECILSARDTLADWKPVTIPKALGSREVPLCEAEAADLDALLNAPTGSPGKLNWTPKAIPTVDASFFE